MNLPRKPPRKPLGAFNVAAHFPAVRHDAGPTGSHGGGGPWPGPFVGVTRRVTHALTRRVRTTQADPHAAREDCIGPAGRDAGPHAAREDYTVSVAESQAAAQGPCATGWKPVLPPICGGSTGILPVSPASRHGNPVEGGGAAEGGGPCQGGGVGEGELAPDGVPSPPRLLPRRQNRALGRRKRPRLTGGGAAAGAGSACRQRTPKPVSECVMLRLSGSSRPPSSSAFSPTA